MSYVMVDSDMLADFLTIVKGNVGVTVRTVMPLFAIIVGLTVAYVIIKIFLK